MQSLFKKAEKTIIFADFQLTYYTRNVKMIAFIFQRDDENQYTFKDLLRELPVGARQRQSECGIPFGAALLNQVGEDGKRPVQRADLMGSREAAYCGKLRWYHRNFLSSAIVQRAFCFVFLGGYL